MDDYDIQDWSRILLGDLPGQFLLEVTLRTLIMFIVIVVTMRLTGKRAVQQLSIIELVLVIGLGSAAGDPMFYHDIGLLPPLVVFIVVLLAYRLITRMAAKSRKVEELLEGRPILILENGQFSIQNFDKEDVGQDEFLMELRLHGIEHLGQIRRAYIEPNGQVSVFYYADDEVRMGLPILPELFHRKTERISQAGTYACTFCGQVEEIVPKDSYHVCPVCTHSEWVQALDTPRIT